MRKKYLKCVGDGYFDCTEGKTYEVFKEDRHAQGVDYYFLDDVGYTCTWSPSSETGDFQVVEETIDTSDLTMNIQWRDMEFSVGNLTEFHDINNAINILRKHLKG